MVLFLLQRSLKVKLVFLVIYPPFVPPPQILKYRVMKTFNELIQISFRWCKSLSSVEEDYGLWIRFEFRLWLLKGHELCIFKTNYGNKYLRLYITYHVTYSKDKVLSRFSDLITKFYYCTYMIFLWFIILLFWAFIFVNLWSQYKVII